MNFKKAVFKFKKRIGKDGMPGYVLVWFEGVAKKDDLPGYYFTNQEHFFLEADGQIYLNGYYHFKRGEFFTEEQFHRVVTQMKRAGDHLHQIMDDIRKQEKVWRGEVIVEI